jgi:hypothetical protein
MSLLDGLFEGGSDLVVSPTVLTASATIAPRLLHLIDGDNSAITLTLATQQLADIVGRRFGVKVSIAAPAPPGGNLIVAVPTGQQIERDDGTLGSSSTLTGAQALGNFREWLCDAEGVWRLIGGTGTGTITAAPASTYENGGSNEISVAGLSGLLADPQRANTLIESSGPTNLTIGAVANGQLLRRSGSGVVGATAAALDAVANLWARPDLAHPDDEEFDTTTLPSAYNWYQGTLGGPLLASGAYVQDTPDPWAQEVGGAGFAAHRYALHTQYRRSMMLVQPMNLGAVTHWYLRPITPTTNMTLWTLLRFPATNAQAAGGGGSDSKHLLCFVLCGESGGLPNTQNCVVILWRFVSSAGFWQQNGYTYVGGSGTERIAISPGVINTRGIPVCTIRKRGTLYGLAHGSDEPLHLRSANSEIDLPSFTPAFAGWGWRRDDAFNAPIYGWDFLRRRDDLVLPF